MRIKKTPVLCIVMVLVLLLVAACDKQSDNEANETLEAVIVENVGDSLLVANAVNSGELYTVPVNGVEVTDENNTGIDVGALSLGEIIRIVYSGRVGESSPAQITECVSIQSLGQVDEAVLKAAQNILQELSQSVAPPHSDPSKEPQIRGDENTAPANPGTTSSPASTSKPAGTKKDPIAEEPQLSDDPIAYEPQLPDEVAEEPQLKEGDIAITEDDEHLHINNPPPEGYQVHNSSPEPYSGSGQTQAEPFKGTAN